MEEQEAYPKKTCEIDGLVRHAKLVKAALAGTKTQQRRDGVYAYPGEEFSLAGTSFRVSSLTRERLGDMTEDDARAEGYPDLEAYKSLILRMHRGMEWDSEHLVWVHTFHQV